MAVQLEFRFHEFPGENTLVARYADEIKFKGLMTRARKARWKVRRHPEMGGLPRSLKIVLLLFAVQKLSARWHLLFAFICVLCRSLAHRPIWVRRLLSVGIHPAHQEIIFEVASRRQGAGSLVLLHRAGCRPHNFDLNWHRLRWDQPTIDVLSSFFDPRLARPCLKFPDLDSIQSVVEMRLLLANAMRSRLTALLAVLEQDAYELAVYEIDSPRLTALQRVLASRFYAYLAARIDSEFVVEVLCSTAHPRLRRGVESAFRRFPATPRIRELTSVSRQLGISS